MATAQRIFVDHKNVGLLGKKIEQTEEAAGKTHHVYFNEDGFHNHIVHHLLSLYGTGANASQLQKGYDDNAGYQRPVQPTHQRVIEDLQTWDQASKYLGKDQYYPDFLAFFQREISSKGWEVVISEYLLAGTEAAADLLVRLHGSLLHPLIQLLYGMEWGQPAIVAEALAQTCVHDAVLKEDLFAAERNANEEYGVAGEEKKAPSIVSLLKEAHGDQELKARVDSDSYQDWAVNGVPEPLLRILSKVKVVPEEVEERTVEMFNATVFMAAGATFHPPKLNKFDFFLIHDVNAAPIYLAINSQPWIPIETKARLLEWKIRLDILQYAVRGVPDLPLDAIKTYEPKSPATASLADILSNFHRIEEDGHAVKLARAAAICQDVSRRYEDREWMILKGDDTWTRIHHLILDSVKAPGARWVRGAGLDEAWDDIPDKPKQ
ncbi:hypothetical protein VPNG_05704 [Cytospora leucostoma]|uniref:HypA protein n=1 Tax=Cytospora leucostoma TaxID=1230097 RepID=A0A423WZX2_9PEZI|nr:hypothetical protein VPNG_05704 [Cytospora leucostoma]